jgi:site-specific DNA recombinase
VPSTNGHGPRRAILYARVSTDEQARSGYSLAQQMEALRTHAEREGLEVLEEVTDAGYSGASLERPGMDRVRELVAGGVYVVIAQDLDRISREPWHYEYLRSLFEDHATELRSLDDSGDDSPMGEFMRYIRRGVAKLEKQDIAKRTRRGKLEKAREGKIVPTMKAPYGFRYNETRDALVVHEAEMETAARIFRMAADGLGPNAIQGRLYEHGVRGPLGGKAWRRDTIKRLVMSDVYLPHSHEEIRVLVSAAVAAGLDPAKSYGVRWWNRHEKKTSYVPDGRSRKKTRYLPRDKEEWIAVPVPSSPLLSREVVEEARERMAAHRAPERKHLSRPWELRGMVRCSCGVLMGTHTVRAEASKGRTYHYYFCRMRQERSGCDQKMIRAEKLEAGVWDLVSGLLKDPEKLAAGMDRLIEQEASWRADGPDRETEILLGKVSECARLRTAYQDQQAAGLMTLDELAEKLKELERAKALAQTELANLSERRRRVEELVRDKEAVLALQSEAVLRGLDDLDPEEKTEVYRLLKLEVTPTAEGMEVSGALLYSESLPFEKASRLLPFSEASRGLSQNFASPTAKELPASRSSVSLRSLLASREAASR